MTTPLTAEELAGFDRETKAMTSSPLYDGGHIQRFVVTIHALQASLAVLSEAAKWAVADDPTDGGERDDLGDIADLRRALRDLPTAVSDHLRMVEQYRRANEKLEAAAIHAVKRAEVAAAERDALLGKFNAAEDSRKFWFEAADKEHAALLAVEAELEIANQTISTLTQSQRTPGTVEVCGWRGPVMGFMCTRTPEESAECENKSCPLRHLNWIDPSPIRSQLPEERKA